MSEKPAREAHQDGIAAKSETVAIAASRPIDPGSPYSGRAMTDASLSLAAPLAAGRSLRQRLAVIGRTAFPFMVVGAIWEGIAHAGLFPVKLFPPIEQIAVTFVRLTLSGILPHHTLDTLVRLLLGFVIAAVFGVGIGLAMGRSRRVEDYLLPIVSILAPIPGLAYTPLFLLWFGPGNPSAILLVGFVSSFAVIYNTWTGVKAVKEIWLRSAQAMGASHRRVFRQVVLPGALPYILTGLRLGLAQAWRILVAVEMLASVNWGLGWMIFGARQFLDTDVMLAGVVVIAAIGLALEKLVFQRLETLTVVRWGMITG